MENVSVAVDGVQATGDAVASQAEARASLAIEPVAVVLAKAFAWWPLWLGILGSDMNVPGAGLAIVSVWMVRGATKRSSRTLDWGSIIVAAVLGLAIELVTRLVGMPTACVFALELAFGVELARRVLRETGPARFEWQPHALFALVAIVGLVTDQPLLVAILATPVAALRLAPRPTLDRRGDNQGTLIVYGVLSVAFISLSYLFIRDGLDVRNIVRPQAESDVPKLTVLLAATATCLVAAVTLVARGIRIGRATEGHVGEGGAVLTRDGRKPSEDLEVEVAIGPSLTDPKDALGLGVTLLGARIVASGDGGPFRRARYHVLADAVLPARPSTWRWGLFARATLYVAWAVFSLGFAARPLLALLHAASR